MAIFAAFAMISPAIRGYILDAYKTVDQVVQTNAVAAYIVTGFVGFASFLALRLTSKS